MPSPFCPACGGSGLVAKCNFAIPCILCKANEVGNRHIGLMDMLNRPYIEQVVKAEQNPHYWLWLAAGIAAGEINPNAPREPRKNPLAALFAQVLARPRYKINPSRKKWPKPASL